MGFVLVFSPTALVQLLQICVQVRVNR